MNPAILVCGATGFIGRNMVEAFVNAGYDVHAVHHLRPAYRVAGVTWHKADLRDADAVSRLMEGMDYVVQAAATTSGVKDIVANPAIHVTDNAVMNSHLFRAAVQAGVKHLVFFSCSVMYPSGPVPVKEEDFDANAPLHPRYFGVGQTKLYLEKMCEFYAGLGSTKFTAIRHSNIYGPHDKFDRERSHVFGATVTKVMTAQDKVTIWGTGEEARDVMHVDDLTAFARLALERQEAAFRLYNAGAGEAVAIRELVARIVALSGKSLTIDHDLSQPTIQTSLSLDCSRAKAELGWSPAVSLDDGIRRTLQWWREWIDPITLEMKRQAA